MPSIDSKLKKYNTKIISLRLATENDAKEVYEMTHDKSYKYYLDRLIPKSEEAARKMIIKFTKEAEKGNVYYFAVEYNGEFAGIVDVFRTHSIDKRAAIGYGLKKEFMGKGIATKALRILLKFIKHDLKMHTCEGDCDPRNIGSRRVMEKNGFIRVGVMKDYYFSHKKYSDRLLYWKVL